MTSDDNITSDFEINFLPFSFGHHLFIYLFLNE